VVDRIESGVAVLEFEDGSVLSVCAEELPQGVTEGEFVRLRLERLSESAAEAFREASA